MKETKIIWQIYKEMYAVSDPPADFEQLVNLAEKNKLGQKIIPFDNHTISEKDYEEIVERNLKNKRLTKQMIKNTVALGCSPKIKRDA